ncbi:hypothetical protein FIBSPDRAFT_951206 [Athelia psychrophila]|uniref:Carbamoyl phosphate synthase ATP-binding domain-containing protein n=1 Tax=Athelia psychrophila TaxID=1759441 RepID=A0A166MY13_9AGAM|nr:hypothetical protein FIBSPDRAFT_951206 [Fibularhizoctonia sp. CBS 109695]
MRVVSSEEGVEKAFKEFARINMLHPLATHPTLRIAVMIKALDCGGGRRIRVVRAEEDIEEAFKQRKPRRPAVSREGAIWTGWMHIEVHIVGDATETGPPMRTATQLAAAVFQKVAEVNGALHHLPPSHEIQLSPAPRLDEDGTGTFEYLVNFHNGERVFLEINPRILVKHTVTASMVPHKAAPYNCASLLKTPPRTSVSPLSSIVWPEGRGARVDTWLSGVLSCIVGTEVYSLLGKIVVVRGRDLGEATQRAGVEKVPSVGISGSREMQPGAIFHLVLSPHGSKGTSDAKKHALTLASIAYNAFPTHLSGTLQSTFSPSPLALRSSKDSPLPASQLAHLTLRT